MTDTEKMIALSIVALLIIVLLCAWRYDQRDRYDSHSDFDQD